MSRSIQALKTPPSALWGWGCTLGSSVLNLLYPPLCLGCGGRVAEREPVCSGCLARLERADPDVVQAQLDRLPDVRHALDKSFVVWHFDKGGVLQKVQHLLKYGNRPRYGVALGRVAGTAYASQHASQPTCVLPIPLHRTRYLERGYNQSAMLATGVAQALGTNVCADALVRRRATRSQTAFARSKRWANVQGAFAVPDPASVSGQSLLLVDDVLTTGATAVAAAQSLKEAGAAEVHLLALALARS